MAATSRSYSVFFGAAAPPPATEVETPGVSVFSRSVNTSAAVLPMMRVACALSLMPASAIVMRLPASLRISGSETPRASTRFRMIETA